MISFICAIPQEPDDKAFMLSLYDSYYKLMYSIAYKYVSDILTVDDIVQDSIVSLYGKIDILKPMPDKVLAGYIVSTVRNTANMGKKYTRNFYSYSKLDINKGE